jgi:glycosyltransferase involved in cell wall biosynthesis
VSQAVVVEAPAVSVLISTRNQADMLAQTLGHFERLVPPRGGWELIVVNNGSDDRTAEILSAAGAHLPLTTLDEERPGKNRALNRAVARALGSLFVFTDDDVVADPNWLVLLREASDRWPSHQIFAGPTIARFPEGTPEWLQNHQVCNFARFHFDTATETELPLERLPYGCNFAVRGDVVRAHRFREDIGPAGPQYVMGGETEFLRRIRAHGARALYVPEARVHHVVRPWQVEFPALYRRAFRLGRGTARTRPPEKQGSIAGMARWNVLGVCEAALQCVTTVLSRPEKKFDARARFHKRLGYAYQSFTDRKAPVTPGQG